MDDDNKLKEISILSFSPKCDSRPVIESFIDGRDYYLIHDNSQRFGKDDNSFCFDPKKEPWDHYYDFETEFCGYLCDTVIVICFDNFSTYNTDSWHTFLGFLRGACVRDRRADWTIYTIDCLPKPDLPCLFYIDEEKDYHYNVKLTFEILAQQFPKWK
jgi:hypothetical protein